MTFCRWSLLSCVVLSWARSLAQDLAPRAYLITPVHSNAVTLSYSFFTGNIIFDGRSLITGATARVNVPILSLTHSLRFSTLGKRHSTLPYGSGTSGAR
jgi:hypothetical protein